MKKKKIILLVDDDIDYLFQLKIKIEQFGFETITAENQKEAESIIETTRPDLAILDLMMEREDSGFVLSYKIKRKYPDVPVIISTAVSAETGMTFDLNSDADREWIHADIMLDKGIRSDQLLLQINRLLNTE
ncbi:MAG: response regulator [Bacteroidia bacterium]|nr:response regulator [Bacteroidales bacterium]NCD41226.1 response regulator [Bacteroidia bacterium]MDD2322173.1 response regulator [Bacteroidales bacterium]MDD3011017.1 response regulator [Bacteroidales bacterium]MDD3960881.1 response regulator [Bacteroidales bacterium]